MDEIQLGFEFLDFLEAVIEFAVEFAVLPFDLVDPVFPLRAVQLVDAPTQKKQVLQHLLRGAFPHFIIEHKVRRHTRFYVSRARFDRARA